MYTNVIPLIRHCLTLFFEASTATTGRTVLKIALDSVFERGVLTAGKWTGASPGARMGVATEGIPAITQHELIHQSRQQSTARVLFRILRGCGAPAALERSPAPHGSRRGNNVPLKRGQRWTRFTLSLSAFGRAHVPPAAQLSGVVVVRLVAVNELWGSFAVPPRASDSARFHRRLK